MFGKYFTILRLVVVAKNWASFNASFNASTAGLLLMQLHNSIFCVIVFYSILCFMFDQVMCTNFENVFLTVCPSKNIAMDLIFLLDGSNSIGKQNFDIVKNWVKNISSHFDISDESTRIGVIQYSYYDSNKYVSHS